MEHNEADMHNNEATKNSKQKNEFAPRSNRAANWVDPLTNNSPVISSAIQLLDQISEVGKVLPFVAPAFVILKMIIDIEKRAGEVDIKCSDLLERITFLLGHIPLLQSVDITPATLAVVERMNAALTDAGALIVAYRKEGPVARRLRLSNRDKFAACADALNVCGGDLLLSLQIHHSAKLDVITRAIPVDDVDTAAETFIHDHGGSVDAVMYDRVLVADFAQREHLLMDDTVMRQLSTDIADAIQQQHTRLETFLRENVSSSIVEGLKYISLEKDLLDSEPKLNCVQCEKEFTASSNSSKSCSFHASDFSNANRVYGCCGGVLPCQYGAHRTRHHSDYPYETFFKSWSSRASSTWANVSDRDLETGTNQTASVGRLSRWTQQGPEIKSNTMFITVGWVQHNSSYFYETYSQEELQALNKSIRLSRRTLIYKISDDLNQYAMAEWVLSDSGDICGVRISAKAGTSNQPFVCICNVDLASCMQVGTPVTLSKGGMCAYKPEFPYVLPAGIRVGPVFQKGTSRAVRADFKAVTTPSSSGLSLKTVSDPPLIANPSMWYTDFDVFHGSVYAVNKDEKVSHMIASVKAMYRLIGDTSFTKVDVDAIEFLDEPGGLVPFTLAPGSVQMIKFAVKVRRTPEDAKRYVKWIGAACLARHRPLRLKIILETFDGDLCSIVLEYVFQLEKVGTFRQNSDPNVILSPFLDNPLTMERSLFYVAYDAHSRQINLTSGTVFGSGGFVTSGEGYDYSTLVKFVYHAVKTGKSEILIGTQVTGGAKCDMYALVDVSCQRIYAFKVIIIQKSADGRSSPQFGTVDYVACPPLLLEECDEVRPVKYAEEIAALPPMDPYDSPDYPQEDNVDDVPILPLDSAPSPRSEKDLLSVSDRLASIDKSLSTSLPKLGSINKNLASIAQSMALLNANMERIAGILENTDRRETFASSLNRRR